MIMNGLKQQFDESGNAVLGDVGLGNPNEIVGKRRSLVTFQKVEIGQENAMREDVFDVGAEQLRVFQQIVVEGARWFPKSLPNVACATPMNGCIAVATNINIGKMARFHLYFF